LFQRKKNASIPQGCIQLIRKVTVNKRIMLQKILYCQCYIITGFSIDNKKCLLNIKLA